MVAGALRRARLPAAFSMRVDLQRAVPVIVVRRTIASPQCRGLGLIGTPHAAYVSHQSYGRSRWYGG